MRYHAAGVMRWTDLGIREEVCYRDSHASKSYTLLLPKGNSSLNWRISFFGTCRIKKDRLKKLSVPLWHCSALSKLASLPNQKVVFSKKLCLWGKVFQSNRYVSYLFYYNFCSNSLEDSTLYQRKHMQFKIQNKQVPR